MLRVTILALITLIPTANAGEFWSYEIKRGPIASHVVTDKIQYDRKWLTSEFSWMPYPEQLEKLAKIDGIHRHTVLFHERVGIDLKDQYIKIVLNWEKKRILGDFKFLNSFLTIDEANALKPVCDLGVKITFYSTQLPTQYEADNLLRLRNCVEVFFSINRYFRFDDLEAVQRLKDIPITVHNDYYPSYIHMDNLNIIKNPVSLSITDMLPDKRQAGYVNDIDRLQNVSIAVDLYPSKEHYENLRKIKVPLNLSWNFGVPKLTDIDQWRTLKLEKVVLKTRGIAQAEDRDALLTALKNLQSPVIFRLDVE